MAMQTTFQFIIKQQQIQWKHTQEYWQLNQDKDDLA
jgi:hypothetical protein